MPVRSKSLHPSEPWFSKLKHRDEISFPFSIGFGEDQMTRFMGKCSERIKVDANIEQGGGDDDKWCASILFPGTWVVL